MDASLVRYDAWGGYRTAPPTGPPTLGFTGHVYDPNAGLVYGKARWYAPELGTWMSEDPVGVTPDRLMGVNGLNAWGYANGNPLRYVDPDGRDGILDFIFNFFVPAPDPTGVTAPIQQGTAWTIDEADAIATGLAKGSLAAGGAVIVCAASGGACVVLGGLGVAAGIANREQVIKDFKSCANLKDPVSTETCAEIAGGFVVGMIDGGPGLAQLAKASTKSITALVGRYSLLDLQLTVDAAITDSATKSVAQMVVHFDPKIGRLSRNSQLAKLFERTGLAYLRTVQSDVVPQVSVRPFRASGELGPKFRLDALGRDVKLRATDFKSSPTAGLTPAQEFGYPLFEKYGGVIVGQQGGAAYPEGLVLPPTVVDILRPGDF